MTKKLEMSDTTISTLKQEVVVLKALVEKLNSENSLLKSRLSHVETGSVQSFVEGDSGCSSLDGFLTVSGLSPAFFSLFMCKPYLSFKLW